MTCEKTVRIRKYVPKTGHLKPDSMLICVHRYTATHTARHSSAAETGAVAATHFFFVQEIFHGHGDDAKEKRVAIQVE